MSDQVVSRNIYLCMDTRGGIRHLQSKRSNSKTYMTDDKGRPLSRNDAINALMDELAQGHECLPMNKNCANPCPYPSCSGFDYSKGGGCSGHISGEEPVLKTLEPS